MDLIEFLFLFKKSHHIQKRKVPINNRQVSEYIFEVDDDDDNKVR